MRIQRPDSHIYHAVFFNPDWLETKVAKALGVSNDVLYSKSEFAKDRFTRGIFFWMFSKYCGLTKAQIGSRYGQAQDRVGELIVYVSSRTISSDKDLVVSAIEPYLPIAQVRQQKKSLPRKGGRSR